MVVAGRAAAVPGAQAEEAPVGAVSKPLWGTPSSVSPSPGGRGEDGRAAFVDTGTGAVADLERLASDMHRGLRAFVAITEAAAARADPLPAIASSLREYLCSRLREHGAADAEILTDEVLSMDIELNAKGLLVWLGRRVH